MAMARRMQGRDAGEEALFMVENKTKPTNMTVDGFIAAVPDPQKRTDAETLRAMFERVTGEPAVMWGPSIVGFGSYHYKYDSGREGDMCRAGFSPRKAALTLYVTSGYSDDVARAAEAKILARLGKYQASKACIYIKRLSDVDMGVLEELIASGWASMNRLYPE